MNTLNPIHHSQTTQVQRNTPLRNAAVSPDLPKLTSDEHTLIKEKFNTPRQMKLYSGDGSTHNSGIARGLNIDTKI